MSSTPSEKNHEVVKTGASAPGVTRNFDAQQLRMDTWNELLQRCQWLKEFAHAGRDVTEPRTLVERSMTTLAGLEFFWAYPGQDRMRELVQLFESGDFGELAAQASEISRMLVGDAYREQSGMIR